eukprot:8037484-Pyramimonas_sp.AAC.1
MCASAHVAVAGDGEGIPAPQRRAFPRYPCADLDARRDLRASGIAFHCGRPPMASFLATPAPPTPDPSRGQYARRTWRGSPSRRV